MQPDDPRGYNKVGAALAIKGDIGGARQNFEHALTLDRKFAPALTNLANIALHDNKVNEALSLYREAIQADPNYAPAHHNFSVALKRSGDVTGMVRSLKQAQRLQRDAMREEARQAMRRGPGGCLRGSAAVVVLATGAALALTHLVH